MFIFFPKKKKKLAVTYQTNWHESIAIPKVGNKILK